MVYTCLYNPCMVIYDDLISEWHVLKDGSGFLLWPTREPCSRSWSYIAHESPVTSGPPCIDWMGPAATLMRKKDHWIHRSDWLMATWLFHAWAGSFRRCWRLNNRPRCGWVAGSPCEEEAIWILAPGSIQLLPQIFVDSCWISVDDYWIKMYQIFIYIYHLSTRCALLCPQRDQDSTSSSKSSCRAALEAPHSWALCQKASAAESDGDDWWWWCSGAIVFLWISYWEAPDEHRGGLTAIGRKNTSFWPRTHRLTGDQRATSDCGFCVLQLWKKVCFYNL